LRCPLSPLIGAFFLNALDTVIGRLRLFYVRFMDDILILASTRWQLRGAVKAVNQVLGGLGLEKHPDKTFIGRIERGFDFLGYHFSPAGLAVAKQTVATFIGKASRLYEQERRAASAASPLGMYVRRWLVRPGTVTGKKVPPLRAVPVSLSPFYSALARRLFRNCHNGRSASRPLYPQQRTLVSGAARSVWCQKQTLTGPPPPAAIPSSADLSRRAPPGNPVASASRPSLAAPCLSNSRERPA
jgi:Reverse transcriptase (RNA-dependent DNA polymerase)